MKISKLVTAMSVVVMTYALISLATFSFSALLWLAAHDVPAAICILLVLLGFLIASCVALFFD